MIRRTGTAPAGNGTWHGPVQGDVTVIEAHLLVGLAHRELGDQRAANQAAEHALALAEQDRVILPFAMTGSAGLLEALPRHQNAHAALLADIVDVLHGGGTPDGLRPSRLAAGHRHPLLAALAVIMTPYGVLGSGLSVAGQ